MFDFRTLKNEQQRTLMRTYIIISTLIILLNITIPAKAARWDLVFLTTSGLNGQLLPATEESEKNNEGMVRTFGGFARIQSIFESYRQKYPDATMAVATGDDLMGESLTNEQGKAIFGTMNIMGFDVSTLGNHEFDRGSKFLVKSLANKKFPTVVSNIKIAPGNSLHKYIKKGLVIEKNYVKVGFMGMILPKLTIISNPGSGISVDSDIIASAREAALELKKKDVDLIVLLSHLDIDDQKKVLENIPEIDIICGGQSHKDILPGQEIIARDSKNAGLMVQCGDHGRFVGVLKIKLSDGIISQHEWTMIPVTEQTKPDQKTLNYVNSQIQSTNTNDPIADSPVALDTRVAFLRTQEAPAGKLIASIMRNKFKTDIAFQNSGGIRGDKNIPAGPVTGKDINKMFPFGNTVTILKVTGNELKQILERSVHKLPKASGAFLQTSGLQYSVDLSKTPQELEINNLGKPVRIRTAGNRISYIKILNKSGTFQQVKPKHKYSISTNSYLARGGDGYIMLCNAKGKVETFIKVRDVIKFGLLDMKKIKIDNTPVIFKPDEKPYSQ